MSRIIPSSKKSVWIALGAALVFQAGLVSVQANHRINTSFIRTWVLDCLAPMEKLVDRTTYGVFHVWDSYIMLVGVHNENQRLKQEVAELRMKLDRQQEEAL